MTESRNKALWRPVLVMFVLMTAVSSCARWLIYRDEAWSDHLVLGAIGGAIWAISYLFILRRGTPKGGG